MFSVLLHFFPTITKPAKTNWLNWSSSFGTDLLFGWLSPVGCLDVWNQWNHSCQKKWQLTPFFFKFFITNPCHFKYTETDHLLQFLKLMIWYNFCWIRQYDDFSVVFSCLDSESPSSSLLLFSCWWSNSFGSAIYSIAMATTFYTELGSVSVLAV